MRCKTIFNNIMEKISDIFWKAVKLEDAMISSCPCAYFDVNDSTYIRETTKPWNKLKGEEGLGSIRCRLEVQIIYAKQTFKPKPNMYRTCLVWFECVFSKLFSKYFHICGAQYLTIWKYFEILWCRLHQVVSNRGRRLCTSCQWVE